MINNANNQGSLKTSPKKNFPPAPPVKDKIIYRLQDVAAYFGVSTGSVRNWARDGRLRVFLTPGGHRRIKKEEYERFIRKYSVQEP